MCKSTENASMSSVAPSSLGTQDSTKMTAGSQWLDMDPKTLSTILQIQLEDVEALSSRAKGKQREGTITDAQLALQVYVEDLATSKTTTNDRKLAEDVTKALLGDIPAIEEAARRERQIALDREFAGKLCGTRVTPSSRQSLTRKLRRNDSDPLKELWPVLLESDSDESIVQAESSTWAASRDTRGTPSMRRCVACAEERAVSEVATVPCKNNHTYCRSCVATMFRLAIEDESLFPPKCDGEEIEIDMVCDFLPRDLVEQYLARSLEFKTKYRTYCHDHSCSAFIPPAMITGLSASCPSCRKTTCILCKSFAHSGECSGDEATRQLKETAANEQWQRCYMCEQVVQLERGCNHITCRCGTQFCYACGSRWKTCSCPYWEEDRLLDWTERPRRKRYQQDPVRSSPSHRVRFAGQVNTMRPSVALTAGHVTASRPTIPSRRSMQSKFVPQDQAESNGSITRLQCAIQ